MSGHYSWVHGRIGAEKVIPGKWVLGTWEVKYASGSTRIVCHIDSVEDGKYIYGTMVIAGQAPVSASGTVSSKHDTIPESFSFFAENGTYNKQNLDANFDTRTKEWRGLYYDRKTIAHEVIFTKIPLTNSETAPKSSTSTQKAAPTKKKVTTEVKAEESIQQVEEELAEEPTQETNENNSSSGNILGEDTMK